MLPVAAMVRAMDTAVIPCGTAAREATVPVCCNARPSINMGYFIYLVGFFFGVCVCACVILFVVVVLFFCIRYTYNFSNTQPDRQLHVTDKFLKLISGYGSQHNSYWSLQPESILILFVLCKVVTNFANFKEDLTKTMSVCVPPSQVIPQKLLKSSSSNLAR